MPRTPRDVPRGSSPHTHILRAKFVSVELPSSSHAVHSLLSQSLFANQHENTLSNKELRIKTSSPFLSPSMGLDISMFSMASN